MVRINTELMLQRRIQLGWTSEELAERSGLDARTIRRLEQGKTRARLHTAVAVAQALTLDTSAFVLNEGSSAGERDADVDSVAAAFKAAENTFQTELTCDGDQNFKEMMYVLSLLLTRALAREGKGLAKQEDAGVHGVVAAFKAADIAIRTTLSGGGELGKEEAISVLSLLLTRYGIAFSRRLEHEPLAGYSMIEIAAGRAMQALAGLVPGFPGYPGLGETDWGYPLFEESREEKLKMIREGVRPLWPTAPIPAPSAFQPDAVSYGRTEQKQKLDKDRSELTVEKSRDKP